MSAPKYEWQPGAAEIAKAAGIPIERVERMDQNTSPFPTNWVPGVIAATASSLNDYPDASYRAVRHAVGRNLGIGADHVVPGAGADELILLAARAFLGITTGAVAAEPTYPLYRIATLQTGAEYVPVPIVAPDFTFPTDAVIRAARDADVVWLCVPANPVGGRPDQDGIEAIIAATDGIVVLDAAYGEFAGDRWIESVDRFHNLLVLHTLSKAYGLGGARIGYALGHPDMIAAIDRVRPPGSLSSVAVELAVAALEHPNRMDDAVAILTGRRDRLRPRLEALGLRVLPSETNFLMCEVGPAAHAIESALRREGLVVRKFDAAGPLAHYLRITVRSPDAHDRLITALERSL
jgi:histidinol-phosphate aminotransferase